MPYDNRQKYDRIIQRFLTKISEIEAMAAAQDEPYKTDIIEWAGQTQDAIYTFLKDPEAIEFPDDGELGINAAWEQRLANYIRTSLSHITTTWYKNGDTWYTQPSDFVIIDMSDEKDEIRKNQGRMLQLPPHDAKIYPDGLLRYWVYENDANPQGKEEFEDEIMDIDEAIMELESLMNKYPSNTQVYTKHITQLSILREVYRKQAQDFEEVKEWQAPVEIRDVAAKLERSINKELAAIGASAGIS